MIGALVILSLAVQEPPRPPGSFLVDKSLTAQVMALGVWHFDYPGLDEHKTDEGDKVDVLTPDRQAQVRAVCDSLLKYAPTKICLEARDQATLDRLYAEYRDGKHRDSRNEIFQLGCRLALELGHEKVYAIDSGQLSAELATDDRFKAWTEALFAKSRREKLGTDPYVDKYREWFEYGDKLTKDLSVRDNLAYMNSDEALRLSHGIYLTDLSRVSSDAAADALSIWWYNRNLRIFSRIGRVKEAGDRLLVIIGAGHVPILKHCFESSPEYQWVPVAKFLD